MDPSSSCFGSSTSGYDDDGEDSEDDDGSSYGNRGVSSSTVDPAGLDVQDTAEGSSASSFSFIEVVGMFALSAVAFIVFGWAALAACAYMLPRWCCWARKSKRSRSGGGGSSSERRDRPKKKKKKKRDAVVYTVRQPSRAVAEAEAAQDWGALAAALRASVDDQKGGNLETGTDVVGTQESKQADKAELGSAFYGTGNSGVGGARSAEGQRGRGASAKIGNVTSTSAVLGAGKDEGFAAEEKKEEHDIEGGTVDDTVSTPAVAGARSGDAGEKQENEEEHEHDIEGDAVQDGGRDISTPVAAVSTAVVVGARSGDDVAAGEEKDEEDEEEHDVERGAVQDDEGDISTPPVVAGAGNVDDVTAEEKLDEHDIEGGAVNKDGRDISTFTVAEPGGSDGDAAAEANDEESEVEGGVVEEDGMGGETEGSTAVGDEEGKETDRVGAAAEGRAGEETDSKTVEDVTGETESTTADKLEVDGAVPHEEGSSDPPDAE